MSNSQQTTTGTAKGNGKGSFVPNPIYSMSLHQVVSLSQAGVAVLRVPGGWVYSTQRTSVFVPFARRNYRPNGNGQAGKPQSAAS